FDPFLLLVTGATSGITLGNLGADPVNPNRVFVEVSYHNDSGIGNGSFGSLIAQTVPTSLPVPVLMGAKSVLDIDTVQVNSAITGNGDSSVQVLGNLGDVTNSRVKTAQDAALIAQAAAGLGSGFTAFRNADPVILGDLNHNGMLDPTDASIAA